MLEHSVLHYLLGWFAVFTLDKCLKLTQIVALVLGGIGAYVRLFKGRIYRGRLEASVSGTAVLEDGKIRITAIASIKNIGHTKLDIDQSETALILCYCEKQNDVPEVISAYWEHLGTFSIFEHDSVIESGETIQDQLMVFVPQNKIEALQLKLDVCAGKSLWISRTVIAPGKEPKPSQRRITV